MRHMIERAFECEGIEVNRSGDGRTVTAYAAVFDQPTMVVDPQIARGPYLETIARTGFNKVIGDGVAARSRVLFNHGKTNEGQPSERYSQPIGTPLEVKADGRGLLTVTRYAKTPLADETLELIREGAITGQSFRGPVFNFVERSAASGLTVQLTEVGLKEYGPVVFPAYAGAEFVSIRSATDLMSATADLSGALTDEDRAEMIRLLLLSSSNTSNNPDTHTGAAPDAATSTSEGTPAVEPSNVDPDRGDIDLLALANKRRRLDS